ncbi:MAG TPA: hypothetical protein VGJ20_37865 [Xanthobacteraceae bacterium]|jgi:hypothetical protein
MADQNLSDQRRQYSPHQFTSRVSLAEKLAAESPPRRKEQADQTLQMGGERLSATGLMLFAVVVLAILTVVLHGLNGVNTPAAPSVASNALQSGSHDNP